MSFIELAKRLRYSNFLLLNFILNNCTLFFNNVFTEKYFIEKYIKNYTEKYYSSFKSRRTIVMFYKIKINKWQALKVFYKIIAVYDLTQTHKQNCS